MSTFPQVTPRTGNGMNAALEDAVVLDQVGGRSGY